MMMEIQQVEKEKKMEVKKYDETNKGVLFNITEEWKLTQQGKLNMQGDEIRIIGVKRPNKDGQPIIELYRAIGTLKQHEKENENKPDAKGVVNIIKHDGAMSISAWKEVSNAGNHYISLKVRKFDDGNSNEKQDEELQNNDKDSNIDDISDDIPF